jgi:hypothetical protein
MPRFSSKKIVDEEIGHIQKAIRAMMMRNNSGVYQQAADQRNEKTKELMDLAETKQKAKRAADYNQKYYTPTPLAEGKDEEIVDRVRKTCAHILQGEDGSEDRLDMNVVGDLLTRLRKYISGFVEAMSPATSTQLISILTDTRNRYLAMQGVTKKAVVSSVKAKAKKKSKEAKDVQAKLDKDEAARKLAEEQARQAAERAKKTAEDEAYRLEESKKQRARTVAQAAATVGATRQATREAAKRVREEAELQERAEKIEDALARYRDILADPSADHLDKVAAEQAILDLNAVKRELKAKGIEAVPRSHTITFGQPGSAKAAAESGMTTPERTVDDAIIGSDTKEELANKLRNLGYRGTPSRMNKTELKAAIRIKTMALKSEGKSDDDIIARARYGAPVPSPSFAPSIAVPSRPATRSATAASNIGPSGKPRRGRGIDFSKEMVLGGAYANVAISDINSMFDDIIHAIQFRNTI